MPREADYYYKGVIGARQPDEVPTKRGKGADAKSSASGELVKRPKKQKPSGEDVSRFLAGSSETHFEVLWPALKGYGRAQLAHFLADLHTRGRITRTALQSVVKYVRWYGDIVDEWPESIEKYGRGGFAKYLSAEFDQRTLAKVVASLHLLKRITPDPTPHQEPRVKEEPPQSPARSQVNLRPRRPDRRIKVEKSERSPSRSSSIPRPFRSDDRRGQDEERQRPRSRSSDRRYNDERRKRHRSRSRSYDRRAKDEERSRSRSRPRRPVYGRPMIDRPDTGCRNYGRGQHERR